MMSNNTVVSLRQPGRVEGPFTAFPISGARRLLAPAIGAEDGVPGHDEGYAAGGRARSRRAARPWSGALGSDGDRPGRGAAREAARPRRRGRGRVDSLRPRILPRWARRTQSLDALLVILYLHGVSMGDFQEALGTLLGKDAPNLSPSAIARLWSKWESNYAHRQRHDQLRKIPTTWPKSCWSDCARGPPRSCWRCAAGKNGSR